jgi:hypothetical protein
MKAKLIPVDKNVSAPYARHIGNKELILKVVEMSSQNLPYGGCPAILTDGVGWFSAELEVDPNEELLVAMAVNGYADEETARCDAESRIRKG